MILVSTVWRDEGSLSYRSRSVRSCRGAHVVSLVHVCDHNCVCDLHDKTKLFASDHRTGVTST
eukprot:3596116-Amphidinium_carterae.1